MSTHDLCESVFLTLFQEAASHVRKGVEVPAKTCLYSVAKNGERSLETTDISTAFNDPTGMDALAQTFTECIKRPEIELATMVVECLRMKDTRSEECVVISLLTKEFQILKLCPIDRTTKTLRLPKTLHS